MSKVYRRWGLVCLITGVCLLLGVFPENRETVGALRLGYALASERRYSAALEAYGLVENQCPGCYQPYLARSQVYVAQGRYEEAWGSYLASLRLGGSNVETMELAAQLYQVQGIPTLAIDVLERLLHCCPGRIDLWMRLANGYIAVGKLGQAQQAFTHMLGMDLVPAQRQQIYDELGMLCIVEFDLDCALAHFQNAASGPDTKLTEKANTLIVALQRVKQADEPALARAKLGHALLQYGYLALAKVEFQSAVDLEPAYVDGHAYLGYVLSELGETGLAAQHLEQAIALEPAYPLPHYLLGMHYSRQGWWITARNVLVQAHDLDRSNPAICAAVAETYINSYNPSYGVAERWLHVAVSNAPDDVRFHLLLAHFYVDYGIDPGVRGAAVAQVAVNLAPESSEAHETLGWAHFLSGHADLALESLLQARQFAPQEPRIHYRLGETYSALGRRQEAVESYQRAIDLDWTGLVGKKARWALEGG